MKLATEKKKEKTKKKITGREWQWIQMLIFPMLHVFIFCYCTLYGLLIAFKDYKYARGIWGSQWVGFKNFEFFVKSNDFFRLIRNTLSLNAQLSDRAGVFSALTAALYGCGANIITVSQGLPENGKANVSLTLSIGSEMSAEELISRLLATDGVISIKRIDGGKK